MSDSRNWRSGNAWTDATDPEEQMWLSLPDIASPGEAVAAPQSTPIAGLVSEARELGWAPEGCATALYVSAGSDTKAPVHLRPEHLASKGLTDVVAPGVFIYTDFRCPTEDEIWELSYEDNRTTLETLDSVTCDGLEFPGRMLHLRFTIDRYGHLMPGNEKEAAKLLDAFVGKHSSAGAA